MRSSAPDRPGREFSGVGFFSSEDPVQESRQPNGLRITSPREGSGSGSPCTRGRLKNCVRGRVLRDLLHPAIPGWSMRGTHSARLDTQLSAYSMRQRCFFVTNGPIFRCCWGWFRRICLMPSAGSRTKRSDLFLGFHFFSVCDHPPYSRTDTTVGCQVRHSLNLS